MRDCVMAGEGRSVPLNIPGFEILRPLGAGGMGTVYLARQTSLGRLVAIKLLESGPGTGSSDSARRFRREAELMAKIPHPNIVTVYDFGSLDGRPFIVMEYVEGRDLRHGMQAGRPMPTERVRSLVPPIVRALDHLHRNGVLHRDLKPENILLGDGSPPKVTDFGIAVEGSRVGSLTDGEQWLGTLGYVAPEIQYRLKVDERADQFSMAAVVYELLTGQKPLGIFKPPSRLNPELGPEADAVLMTALQEDREDRYPTIVEFGDALEKALARPRRPKSKSRGATFAAAILALLALAALLTISGRSRRGDAGRAFAQAPARITNSLGMTLRLIRPGTFLMGSPASDPDAAPEEKPQHPVRLTRPYYLGACEVTVRQFRAFVEATGYRTEAEAGGGGFVFDFKRGHLDRDPSFNWRHPGYAGLIADDAPVVHVTWNDAMAFCRWLSGKEGRPYRLPTEAEWEYACRAGGSTRWSVGDSPEGLGDCAWTRGNAGPGPHPVGRKRPNAFGLHDMHGNAWEWCLDWYSAYPPGRVDEPTGPPSGRERVLRGGSWDWDDLARTRSAARLDSRPNYAYFSYGFRICSPLPK